MCQNRVITFSDKLFFTGYLLCSRPILALLFILKFLFGLLFFCHETWRLIILYFAYYSILFFSQKERFEQFFSKSEC